ncbi:unnamed protein product [Schistosoma rodhaini]|nr:unnamed protein product [Schistosoma rodhaini]
MKSMYMNMNSCKTRKDIATQTDSASEYSSETDGSDESEINNYSGFDSNLISSKLSTNSSQAIESTIIELTDVNNNNKVTASSHNLPGCDINATSFPTDTTGQLIQHQQVQRSDIIVKSNSQQVYFNSSVDTHNSINNNNNTSTINHSNLTDCDKRNSSASLDSGRDSTYATGSEGSSGVQYPQQYSSDDGYILSPTLPYCYNSQISRNNTISTRKINHNSNSCTSFDHNSSLPVATILPFYNHHNSTIYNVSNCCVDNNSSNASSSHSRNSSCHQFKQYHQQQFNKDDTLTSPTHKYNNNSSIDNKIVNSMLQCTEPCEYYHIPSYQSARNCCSTTNLIKPSTSPSSPTQQQQSCLASYSPCQEKHFTDFDVSRLKIPANMYHQSQFLSNIPTQPINSNQCQQQSHQSVHSVLINPDDEALFAWLRSVGLSRLSGCLSKSGFDLWTLCHTTPEELNACGITNPFDRQILRNQLATLQLSDPFTEKQLPASVHEWLIQLHLQQYWPKFNDQGLITFEQIIRITWDDLEEIGVSKLGHQKKLLTAISKLNRLVLSSKINCTTTGYNLNPSMNYNKSIYPLQKDINYLQSSTSSFVQNDNGSSSSPLVNCDYMTKLSQHQPNQHNVDRTSEIKKEEYRQQSLKVSEIGVQVEESLTKSHTSPSSPCSSSSNSTSDLSSNNSRYSLPPPVDFQDSPPKSSSSCFPTISLIQDSEHSGSNLQQSNSSCIINGQLRSNLSSCTTIANNNAQSSHSLCNIHNPINVDNTLLNTNSTSIHFSSSEYQKEEQLNKVEQSNIFRRRSSNPTLYSLKPNDPVQNTNDLSKWSSGLLTTPQLRLPINVNSNSDPDLEAMHNIQIMLDQISERLILTNK